MTDYNELAAIRASTGQRFATCLLDLIFCFVFTVVVSLVLGFVGMAGIVAEMNVFVLGALFMLLYYVPQESTSGQTLGKRIVGTRVVSLNGKPVTVVQAIGRTLCRATPIEVFSFLGGDGRPLGWHDRVSATQVVVSKQFALMPSPYTH